MKQHKFSSATKMAEIIDDDLSFLQIISRFGLSLGFGEKTVKEVCEENKVDTFTFLSVVNFLSESNYEIDTDAENISIKLLIDFLKNGHVYFLKFKLPALREKLITAIDITDAVIPYRAVFLQFFDKYVVEVENHMNYEDEVVFPYVMNLLNGKANTKYHISMFEERHNDIEQKLTELKNILIKYYPAKENNYLFSEVLYDLMTCKKDLTAHSLVEDYIFIPAIEKIEQKTGRG
jgi:regulator of cell morphogenesis and NO signaling